VTEAAQAEWCTEPYTKVAAELGSQDVSHVPGDGRSRALLFKGEGDAIKAHCATSRTVVKSNTGLLSVSCNNLPKGQ